MALVNSSLTSSTASSMRSRQPHEASVSRTNARPAVIVVAGYRPFLVGQGVDPGRRVGPAVGHRALVVGYGPVVSSDRLHLDNRSLVVGNRRGVGHALTCSPCAGIRCTV